MSADAAAPAVPDVEVPVKAEETTTAAPTESAETSTKPGKVQVAALPSQQPADIPDAVVSAEILQEAPPVRDGKTEDEVRELAANAAQLVAFYFSDSNLPNDRYLFTLTACNEPIYGWVPISVLASFSRMRAMGMSAADAPFIAWALRRRIAEEGENSLLAISEDGLNVRRKRVLEKDGADLWARSAYVKGFGERGQEDEKTQESIEKYMRQFGLVNSVRLRREDAGKPGKGKGKGKFKGSIFVEFASIEDLKSFLARESIPKYEAEGAEMEYKSKEDYCVAKAKEKNIPDYSVAANRSNDANRQSGSGFNKNGPSHLLPFNAFREAANLKEGRKANLAAIQETTPVVGKRIVVAGGSMINGGGRDKRKREDDAEGDKKRVFSTEPLEMQYKDVTLKIDRETGQVLDKTQVPFTEDSMVLFTGEGEKSDWRVLKEDIMKIIEKPFLAAPPGSGGGKLAKSDSSVITEEDLQKLKDAKITHGGVEIVWSRPSTKQMQDFWATRASFQGAAIAKANREKEHEKEQSESSFKGRGDRRDGGGRDRDGGRGGGRGRGGRGGGRGGNRGGRGGGRGGNRGGHRGGNRGGRGGHRDNANGGGSAPTGLPPTLSSA